MDIIPDQPQADLIQQALFATWLEDVDRESNVVVKPGLARCICLFN